MTADSGSGDPTRRFNLRGRTLRQHAARGTLINTAFMVALSFLGFLKGFVLAGFLTAEDYGIWGITIVTMSIIATLQHVGIGDKYIQQDDPDQEGAFQRAFTLSLMLAGVLIAATLVALPVMALVYGQPEMVAPGLFLALNWLAGPFQMPIWFHYRRMEFVRQRVLQSVEPVMTLVVSLALAAAGAGHWALFIGAVAGGWSASLAAVTQSPYRFRWRYERGTLASYWSFSWPLLVAASGGLLIAQAAYLSVEGALGIAAAGALTLAATISQFTDRVDQLVTGTLYPAICAVRDRTEVLYESFVKSNRLALMWAMPFGFGLTLFSADLVEFAIGDKWEAAVPLLQTFGVIAALGHIGFNWDAYFRALGETRPMAIAAGAAAVTFLVVGVPLVLVWGLEGVAVGSAAQMVVHVGLRAHFLRRLFDGFPVLRHASRAIVPTIPAVAIVLAARALESGERTVAMVAVEAALFFGVTVAATWAFEGRLLREAIGYVRARRAAGAAA